MSRRKVVTSVSIEPTIFQMGRDMQLNFSEILEQGIISAADPSKEKEFLMAQVDFHNKETDVLMQRIKDLEKVEEKVKKGIIEGLADRYIEEYRLMGVLPDDVMYRYSTRLGISIGELNDLLAKSV